MTGRGFTQPPMWNKKERSGDRGEKMGHEGARTDEQKRKKKKKRGRERARTKAREHRERDR